MVSVGGIGIIFGFVFEHRDILVLHLLMPWMQLHFFICAVFDKIWYIMVSLLVNQPECCISG